MYGVTREVYGAWAEQHFIHYHAISYIKQYIHDKRSIFIRKLRPANEFTVTKRIIISKGSELVRVPVNCLMYVSSEGNYSNVVTSDGRSRLVTYQLGQIEDAINDQLEDEGMTFLRLGRSLIINTEYIYLVDVTKQILILSDFHGSYHELSASKEVLAKLKAYIESIEKTNHD